MRVTLHSICSLHHKLIPIIFFFFFVNVDDDDGDDDDDEFRFNDESTIRIICLKMVFLFGFTS